MAQTAVVKREPVAEYGAVTGRHRNSSGLRRALSIVLTLVAVLAVGTAGWGGYRYLNRPACTGSPLTLTVAASPDIAPAIQSTGNTWASSRTTGQCVAVTVVAADPADVATTLAAAAGAPALTGLGQANGKAQIPDVWVPDSSLWLARLAAATKQNTGVKPPSIASSPVVFAAPEPVAKQLGWPDKPVTWQTVLATVTSGSAVKTGIVNPSRDAAGLAGLLTLAGVAQAAPNADQLTVAALRSLAQNQSTIRADLLGKFPKAADPAAVASGLGAAPLTEQAVLGYNASQPPVPLAAIYLQPAAIAMDYPYVVIPNPLTGDAKKQLAADLLTQLQGAAFKNALAQQNLRAPDGSFGTGFSAGPGAPATLSPPAATDLTAAAAGIDKVLNTWQAVTQSGRMLTVIDVSGSMLEKVPTAGNKSREEVTVAAAGRGLGLLDDSWALGVWVFSTNMVGTQPWKELLPIGPLAVQRPAVLGALGQVKPKPTGDTGLYDTTVAAYKTVQQGWDPGKVNSVVIFTDGQNDNKTGIQLPQLTQQLKSAADPARPIQLIIIGIGDGVSKAELDQIVAPVGGADFVVADPTKISDVFLQAIALRQRN
jgi:Ca-activated chloride channel family protein